MKKKRQFMLFVAALALALISGQAYAQLSATLATADYTLTILAKTGDTIGGKTLTGVEEPVINNHGTVAFFGDFSGGGGIFITRQSDDPGGQPSLLAKPGDTIGGQTLTGLGFIKSAPAINNHGTVAFVAVFSGGSGIFTQSSLLVKTGDTIGGPKP